MKKLLSVFLFLSILYSCQKTNDDNTSNSKNGNSVSNFVSLDEATKIAEMQAPTGITNDRVKTLNKQKVKTVFSIKPDSDNPSMYIVNYANSGFIIVSADNRLSPVLAYSENNSFPTDQTVYPGGLVDWLSAIDENVKKIRKDNPKQDEIRKKLWDKFKIKSVLVAQSSTSLKSALDVNECTSVGQLQTYFYSKGPLTLSTWDQGNGYNELLKYSGCPYQNGRTNGRVWTGCTATSTAQVMRYWQYPTSYNWAAMPYYSGSAETSRLMRDIGLPTNLNMDYSSCEASGARDSDIPATLSHYGYPASNFTDYNYTTVKGQIQNNRPVILSGGSKVGWWVFGKYTLGHSWVCDGFEEWQYFTCQFDPNTPGEWIEYYVNYDVALSMNWGWGGYYNGWYSAYNFSPGTHSYNYQTKMVINIRKP